jgi:Zn-finger nucleic acid-binding protein
MKCLVCKTNELEEQYLENGLKVHSCRECNGKWLRFNDYFEWNKSSKEEMHSITEEVDVPAEDSKNAKLCPDCRIILTVYRVSSKLAFRVEQCSRCNGIWFDKNEWESIRKAGLHNRVLSFFTDSWQKKIREEERIEFLEKHYTEKFGAEDYERLKQVKKWIDENENKSSMLAYLMKYDVNEV